MKNIIIVFSIIFIFISLSAFSDDEELEHSRVQISNLASYKGANGHAWKKIDTQSKIMFLVGLQEGLVLLPLQMQKENRTRQSIVDAVNSGQPLIPGFRFSDVIDQMNSFYADSSNLKIPIMEAYGFVIRKIKGASPKELENKSAALRRTYDQ